MVAGADCAGLGGDGAVIRFDGLDGSRLLQDGQQEPLPVGEENDRLDGEELQDRLVGPQQVLGGEVEEEESVESQGQHGQDEEEVENSEDHRDRDDLLL